jgi:mono/diheme cytochrome c family protein
MADADTSSPTRPRARRPSGGWLAAVVLLASCHTDVARDDAPLTAEERAFVHTEGELLMARSNCTACHRAEDATVDRLRPLAAPRLGGIGWRVSPEWLTAWLDHGHELRDGSRMPDVLHDLDDPADRAETIDELVHFLMTLGGGYDTRPVRADTWDVKTGARLFDELGCRACHVDGVDGALAAKTDLPRLTEFLLDPLRHRPSGAMPDMDLDADEATALASWLLADQLAAGPRQAAHTPGLEVAAYEIPFWPAELPDWSELEPSSVGSAETIDVSAMPRSDEFGLVFRGEVSIPSDGEHTFFVLSDDGSRLTIGGQVVVDHDGHHSPTRKDGTATLAAGWHPIVVEMFEAGGGEAIDAGFVDADGEARSFSTTQLRHLVTRYEPLGHDAPWELDRGKAFWGRIRFKMRRCGTCHELNAVDPRYGPHLAELQDLEAGCLAEDVPGKLPDYRFSADERGALRQTLANPRALAAPLPAERAVEHTLQRLDCLACHARDGRGGPAPEIAARFAERYDLGDEGRLPPDLTGVGGRLLQEWLSRVFAGEVLTPGQDEPGTGARPYMPVRMPRFGAQATDHLASALVRADAPPAAPPEPESSLESLTAGRALGGKGGLSCITCHSVAGHEGTGLPGLDLATTSERMTWAGFHQWMTDPIARTPGTRMPTFFDEGQSVQGKFLDGDAEAQIAALWHWLAMGEDLLLPPGLVVDRAAYDQVPVDRPVILSVFMEGLSARTLAIGYPERVSAAYDLEHARLARLWRGDFLNVEGTWHGRAGQLESPAGHSVLELPPGPAIWRVDEPWPEIGGREAGWRMKEQSRDDEGRPAFTSIHEAWTLAVQETLEPILDPDHGRVLRSLSVMGDPTDVALRAALSASIVRESDGGYVTAEGVRLIVSAGRPTLRETDAGTELLVAPALPGDDLPVDMGRGAWLAFPILVEMVW